MILPLIHHMYVVAGRFLSILTTKLDDCRRLASADIGQRAHSCWGWRDAVKIKNGGCLNCNKMQEQRLERDGCTDRQHHESTVVRTSADLAAARSRFYP